VYTACPNILASHSQVQYAWYAVAHVSMRACFGEEGAV